MDGRSAGAGHVYARANAVTDGDAHFVAHTIAYSVAHAIADTNSDGHADTRSDTVLLSR
jgi:hypothetical protein